MRIENQDWRTIWLGEDGQSAVVIDQTILPHRFETLTLRTLEEAADAISTMVVRGAPLIGVTGAYGMMLAMQEDPSDAGLDAARETLFHTRPTAVNLGWALDRLHTLLAALPPEERVSAARKEAAVIAEEDVAMCAAIGEHGAQLLQDIHARKGQPIHVLTHCNAGWLATVDWGTALAPIYKAHRAGVPLHVWVDETRPRNQGANLTAFELGAEGIDHSVIVDNAGGHLMQHGQVDAVIVGSDRTTASGDVCNKIGTYLKALAAHDNDIPFYAALPSSTIDWTLSDGVAEVPIEERSAREVTHIQGLGENGEVTQVQLTPSSSKAANPAFDVTPSRLVTGIITENGVCEASDAGLQRLFNKP
ncbi:MAG: S-methyl-5-thioribose-1-phosphate isomerase [Myxococcota bacterium]|nr:S-methyl-5-thioribose-1-phosphate isomerase [Myxococcota bacterium]